MFDIGFWELLIIGAVALLVVGPDRLPGLATFIGHWVGRARGLANHMRKEIQQELEAEQLKKLVDEQKDELSSLRQEVQGVRDDAETAVRDIERADSEAARGGDTGAVARDEAADAGAHDDGEAEPTAPAGDSSTGATEKAAARKKASSKKAAAKKKGAARKKASSRKKTAARTSAAATGLEESPAAGQDDAGSAQSGGER